MYCSFCNEYPTEGYFKSYCLSCANLRRMLVLYDSSKCIDILNRILLRTDTQISNKIQIELKRNMVSEINKISDDNKEYDRPPATATRSKSKVEKC